MEHIDFIFFNYRHCYTITKITFLIDKINRMRLPFEVYVKHVAVLFVFDKTNIRQLVNNATLNYENLRKWNSLQRKQQENRTSSICLH